MGSTGGFVKAWQEPPTATVPIGFNAAAAVMTLVGTTGDLVNAWASLDDTLGNETSVLEGDMGAVLPISAVVAAVTILV